MAEDPQLPESAGWAEVVNASRGHVFFDEIKDGVRRRVWAGDARTFSPMLLCRRITHSPASPQRSSPIDVHWGVNETWTENGWYFYKWDYGHTSDCSIGDSLSADGKKWTVKMVKAELILIHHQTVLLANLAELIYMNGKVGR